MKFCELLELNPSREHNELILESLTGMPQQIFYAANLIKINGISHVVNNMDKIKRYNDTIVYNLIEQVKSEGTLFFDILVFISQLEFISYDNIYSIMSKNQDTFDALDKLYLYGVYDRIGQNGEYIKAHHAISDYIKRAKYYYSKETKLKIDSFVKNKLLAPDVSLDTSELLLTIRNLIKAKEAIPQKYHLPSFILRIIIEHYHARDYKNVETLSDLILSNHRKYDESIVREIRYFLCMSYARDKNKKFYDHIREFKGIDYYFLSGFNKRVQKQYDYAEQDFRKALDIHEYSPKSRRELVNVLLAQRKYSEAYEWAEENYEASRLNSFHIHAFFLCITRQKHLQRADIDKLDELLQNIKLGHDPRSKEMYDVMLAEYLFYVKDDLQTAQVQLNKILTDNPSNKYPAKALADIFYRAGYPEQAEVVIRNNNIGKDTLYYEE